MSNSRIKQIESRMMAMMADVRQQDLLKNIELGNMFLRKFGKFKQDIKFEELRKVPKNKTLPLPSVKGGVILTTNITYKENKESLFFEVVWTAGATLTLHAHGDATERITVRKGLFTLIKVDEYDLEERMNLTSGDVINIGAGVYHQITALEKGRMTIKFTKVHGDD